VRRAELVVRKGDIINAYNILAGKHGGKRPLGRLSRRWEDNTKMDLGVMGVEGVR
jgi:hypothetical protein